MEMRIETSFRVLSLGICEIPFQLSSLPPMFLRQHWSHLISCYTHRL